MFFVKFQVLAAQDIFPPTCIGGIPIDSLLNTFRKILFRRPVQFFFQPGGIDSVTPVMAGPVLDEFYQTCRLAQEPEDYLGQIEIGQFVAGTDIVNLSRPAVFKNFQDRLAIVLDIYPITDIFSLGIVFFQLLTGQLPFGGKTLTELFYQITQAKHPSPRQLNPKVIRPCEQLIDKALAKDPEQRFQRAGNFAKYLRVLGEKIDEARAKK